MSEEKTTLSIPSIKELLKTGIQFGHSSSRWNPKMRDYIFGKRNGIDIIDVVQTRFKLVEASKFIHRVSQNGEILFVGTKRQVSDIIQKQAEENNIHFVANRWPGGLLTNFKMTLQSLNRLNSLERQFEEGVKGRTKYEVVQMKNEWSRLSRLYEGVKTMKKLPVAVFIIDPRYERVARKEAENLNIPIIGLVDTNDDPDLVTYPIPGNDDALMSVEIISATLAKIVSGNPDAKKVEHVLKDYKEFDVEITKANSTNLGVEEAFESNGTIVKKAIDKKPKTQIKVSSSKVKKLEEKKKLTGSKNTKEKSNISETGLLGKKKQ